MKKLLATAVLAVVAMAGSAIAQDATPGRPATGPREQNQNQETQAGQRQAQQGQNFQAQDATSQQNPLNQQQNPGSFGLDQQIAGCLLLGNLEEVALAQFAKEHCEQDQCKEFANKMVEQHQQLISKIEQASPQLASLNLTLRNADAEGRQGDADRQDQTASAGQSNQAANAGQAGQFGQSSTSGNVDPALLLARQVKEECLGMVKKALGEKKGKDFDACYIQQQVGAHMAMLAQLKGSEPFASAQLKPLIQEGIQVTEQHLDKAKELAKKMDDRQKEDSRQASN